MQITVDAKNKLCPAPLILTKQAITQNQPNCQITVECNNETAKENILTYLKELKINAECTAQGAIYAIVFTNPEKADTTISPEDYCNSKKRRTIVIKSECMGEGDDTLGKMLMRAFINALPEADIKPDTIILYNSGVKTALKGSDTAQTLKALENSGIKIVVCGTCVDFYNVRQELTAGEIGNMYRITEILMSSDTVVYP